MSFGSVVIASFSTGTYTVTRPGLGTTVDGHYTSGAPTTFSIDASVQPLSGRALRDLKEGQRADDVKWVYTSNNVQMNTVADNRQPDVITIDGDPYRVTKVERFVVISDHSRYTVERTAVP